MDKYNQVLKLRTNVITDEKKAKKFIKKSIKKDIIPHVPLIVLLKYYRESNYEIFTQFLHEQYVNSATRYYFGKKRFFNYYFDPKKFRIIKRKPDFGGNYGFVVFDLKCMMISKIILGRPSDDILFSILMQRPLTLSEYYNLGNRHPCTQGFIEAALGFSHEKLFNKIFQEKTGVCFHLPLAEFLADVYV